MLPVNLLQALAVLAAGFAAGGINAIVGSGSLITFPVLLAVGFAPVTANLSHSPRVVFRHPQRRLGLPARAGGPAAADLRRRRGDDAGRDRRRRPAPDPARRRLRSGG